ncbi:protein nanos-like [Ceratitis capitata]|uniref:(Mediterranean fruit fly) hypothetical protein n=1 Tax=Ceratitis capitata TaxID=7213 RepID=M9TJE1_CERCA|nr:protein nanos-like [Ceratitis capitata]AGJ49995.1 nanos [Ceratitis capitata]AGJ49996.1 nanos [Ceratitis capitata]CAD6992170.1 unnamed protein product [Ceratitis capitata]
MLGAKRYATSRGDAVSFLEFGSLDIKCIPEIGVDRTIASNCSPSLSPTSTESSISYLSSDILSSYSPTPIGRSITPTWKTINNLSSDGVLDMNVPVLMKRNENVHQGHNEGSNGQLALQQHFGKLLYYTQNQMEQKDEISKSLKMFALLASCKYENDPLEATKDSPVDDIMEEFYCNGYVADEKNLFQQGKAWHNPYYNFNTNMCNNNGNQSNLSFGVINYGHNNSSVAANHSINNNNALNQHCFEAKLGMLNLPAPSPYFNSNMALQIPQQNTAGITVAAAAAAANIDYNNKNSKKAQKRYSNAKLDKFSAVKHCVFCENNNEPEAVVRSHAVRDSLGRVLCPKLRTYICPICKASGDKAHTVKYCPQKPIITMEDAVKAESLRLAKNLYFKQGMKV